MTDSVTKGRGNIRMVSGGIPHASTYERPQLDPATAWQGQVEYFIPTGSTLDADGKSITVPFTKRTKLVITGRLLDKLNLVDGCVVRGKLTVCRSTEDPTDFESMSLEIGGKKSALELRASKHGPVTGTVWQKPVPGGRICIVRSVVELLPAPMAVQQPAVELAAAA